MKIWRSISMFLAGVITGLLIYLKMKDPDQVINADSYIEDQDQKVGKIKQKGKDNELEASLEQTGLSRKEIRKQKRISRKAKRISRKSRH